MKSLIKVKYLKSLFSSVTQHQPINQKSFSQGNLVDKINFAMNALPQEYLMSEK